MTKPYAVSPMRWRRGTAWSWRRGSVRRPQAADAALALEVGPGVPGQREIRGRWCQARCAMNRQCGTRTNRARRIPGTVAPPGRAPHTVPSIPGGYSDDRRVEIAAPPVGGEVVDGPVARSTPGGHRVAPDARIRTPPRRNPLAPVMPRAPWAPGPVLNRAPMVISGASSVSVSNRGDAHRSRPHVTRSFGRHRRCQDDA